MTNVDKTRMKIIAKQFTVMNKRKDAVAFFPDKMNPFNWHISFKGLEDSDFQGGIYHCQLKLTDYPDKSPEIIILNESGAYHVNEPLCIHGLTDNYPEDWTSGTKISVIVNALKLYMNLEVCRDGLGFIQVLNQEEIKKHRDASKQYKCSNI
ncbi:Ubiquitin-conjugating_enzyme E2 [Hexamita inflata]|uniref:Ubiquitin-conjugating enzyme E2 n=1 Tax=Hexamita inflata TaxID=28002 RepID=A0AA86VB39_9EUKA|nr:Ubiquitin-conjugating enzyme E2 [Hexamita inflata]